MSTTTSIAFRVGATVHVNPEADLERRFAGRSWVIEKINPVNLILKPKDGEGRGLRIAKQHVVAGEAPPRTAPSTLTLVHPPYAPAPQPGSLIKVHGAEGYHVVVAEVRSGVRAFPLGGSHRYLTNLQPRHYTVVPLEAVTIAPESEWPPS